MNKNTKQLVSQLLDTSMMRTQYPKWLCDLMENAALHIKDCEEIIEASKVHNYE